MNIITTAQERRLSDIYVHPWWNGLNPRCAWITTSFGSLAAHSLGIKAVTAPKICIEKPCYVFMDYVRVYYKITSNKPDTHIKDLLVALLNIYVRVSFCPNTVAFPANNILY
jgi:hypothetical protein